MKSGYDRREFLKTIVVTAGAVTAAPLLGCGDDSGTGTPDAGPDAAGAVVSFPQSLVSGDPRQESIVLWTRAATTGSGDVDLTLELSTNAQFTTLVALSMSAFKALASADHCLRVKVTGLTAGTTYYYRFKAGTTSTNNGRFKTAAAASVDTAVKFSFLSCQDYIGKFYNTLVELLDASNDDMDFVVHLGDYVYETTGNPQFQSAEGRKVEFTDTAGAIPFGTAPNQFYAAKSLSNYRELWKTYRSDPTLQKVHEKFAFINIWDDHEFSDDCWQDVGTYTNGLQNEKDTERRKNAEQAFFEYQPVALDSETAAGALSLGRDQLFPNTKLYRDFRFGKHMHLIMTDYRSFRPDHPIPEDGFPGKVVLDEATLKATLGANEAQSVAFPQYLNLDDSQYAAQKAKAIEVLTAQYMAFGLSATRAGELATAGAQGKFDLAFLNGLWKDLTMAEREALTVPAAGLPHGISYASMGKSGLFGQLGARYLVVKSTYELYNAYLNATSEPSEDAYGATQSAWLTERLAAESDATWTVVGNSTAFTSLMINLAPFAALLVDTGVPPTTFYLNVDQWDGFPVRRKELFGQFAAKNVVIISGDVHAAYFSDYGADASGNRVVELTGPGVSSGPFAELLLSTANSVPGLMGNPMVATLISIVDDLIKGGTGIPGPTDIAPPKFADSHKNGVVVVSLTAAALEARYSLLAADKVTTDMTGDPAAVQAAFVRKTVTMPKTDGKNGTPVLS